MKLIVILFTIWLTGCASIATKSHLEPMSRLPNLKTNPSVTYRFYLRTESGSPSAFSYGPDSDYEKVVREALEKSGYFTAITPYANPISKVALSGDNIEKEEALLLAIDFPIESDFFLNIEARTKDRPTSDTYFDVIHYATLGLIPIWRKKEITLKLTLFDKTGKQVLQNELTDSRTIIWWSPLILVTDLRFFTKTHEFMDPVRRNIVRVFLKGMNEQTEAPH